MNPLPSDATTDRAALEAAYALFDKFALKDQRNFYESAKKRHRAAAVGVNRVRATLALLTGAASAIAGLLVTSAFDARGGCSADVSPVSCGFLRVFVGLCTFATVVLPALAAALNILADLYQWNRLIQVYTVAQENMIVADSLSPDREMDNQQYREALTGYSLATLHVMEDEAAQWGQLIRAPEAIQEFIDNSRKKGIEATNLKP